MRLNICPGRRCFRIVLARLALCVCVCAPQYVEAKLHMFLRLCAIQSALATVCKSVKEL